MGYYFTYTNEGRITGAMSDSKSDPDSKYMKRISENQNINVWGAPLEFVERYGWPTLARCVGNATIKFRDGRFYCIVVDSIEEIDKRFSVSKKRMYLTQLVDLSMREHFLRNGEFPDILKGVIGESLRSNKEAKEKIIKNCEMLETAAPLAETKHFLKIAGRSLR